MKLAIVDQVGTLSGVGTFLQGLVRGLLAEPATAGWDFQVLMPEVDYSGKPVVWPDDLRDARLRLELDGNVKDSVEGKDWIESHLSGRAYDLAYFAYPYLSSCPDLARPFVATPHDFNFKRFDTWAVGLRARVEQQLPGWLERARAIVVSSRFIAAELSAYYPLAAERTRVVRLGIPAGYSGEAAPSPVTPPFLVTVGWLAQHKNQAVVFRALAALKREGVRIPLAVVGPNAGDLQAETAPRGSYAWHLRRLADDLGLELGVDYLPLGYVSRPQLEALYRSATAIVMPTLYEAGSFPIREALRLGCPALCSDIPALREEKELVGSGIELFDPLDPDDVARALRLLLGDQAAARSGAQAAATRVQEVFDWAATARGYTAAFEAAAAA